MTSTQRPAWSRTIRSLAGEVPCKSSRRWNRSERLGDLRPIQVQRLLRGACGLHWTRSSSASCGADMSLRWALTQMIAEYTAHSGQADLIRERIDGKKGW